MTKQYIGIDYSLGGPAVCCYKDPKEGSEWGGVENCKFIFLSGTKKHARRWVSHDTRFYAEGMNFPEYENDMIRFAQNAALLRKHAKPKDGDSIAVEGYAFAAKGRSIFQIGEATGIMMLLFMTAKNGTFINDKKSPTRFAPGSIKKFATGSGNATKEKMYEAWLKETGVDLQRIFDIKTVASPINDIVDSYFISKLLFFEEKPM